jgi:hypothetical protein
MSGSPSTPQRVAQSILDGWLAMSEALDVAQGILHGWLAMSEALDVARAESNGGEGGIRTPGTVARAAVFKTAAFDRSATSPIGRFENLKI